METVKHLGKVGGNHGHSSPRLRTVGGGFHTRFEAAVGLVQRRLAIVRRDIICHASAAVFCALVVIPAVMIFGNRKMPFEIGFVFFKPTEARAGDTIMLNFTLTRVNRRCRGEVRQRMFDSAGHIWDLGTIPSSIEADIGDGAIPVHRPKKIPEGFASGPALYRSRVYHWCNPLQWIYPMERVIEVRFEVHP